MADRNPAFSNHLLRTLSGSDLALLTPFLHPTALDNGTIFETPGGAIERLYFPESGMISVVAEGGGRRLEAAMIGYEGMTGSAVLLEGSTSSNVTYVQIRGTGNWIDRDDLRSALTASASLRAHLLRYVQTLTTQFSQTALAIGHVKVRDRLARWLLMVHDRVQQPSLPLTHDLIALMLGVRRPGVTDALAVLEGEHLIRAQRGLVTVRDRDGLIALAGAIYGRPEAEYAHLFGAYLRPAAAVGTGLKTQPFEVSAASL